MFRYSMLTPGDRVVAAVSGGRDSVCLLAALCELAGRGGFSVSGVAHLNHKLRGEASDEDERFVAALAARHGVPFYREEASVGTAGGNLEENARRARLRFFARLIGEGKATRIATGHTRDDQAETVLFRLLRGSGLAGLAGILPVTKEGLIRPLVDVSRAEVEDFLRSRGMIWREDGSNCDRRFARNRIRHDLLPHLKREWNPEIAGALAQAADLAGEEERWWQGKIARIGKKLWVESDGGVELRADALAALPLAVCRRLVRDTIRLAGGGPAEFGHVEKVIRLAKGERASGCLELPGMLVTRSFEWLRFTAPETVAEPEAVQLEVPGRYRWAGGEVCFEVAEKPARAGCVSLKWKRQSIAARLELRGWKAGDHYRPWGRSRDQKIKEMFQKARVPSWKRDSWPIVTNGYKILWVREFGAAAEFAAEGSKEPSLWIWEEKSGPA
jgi:tRNA(Ile)-lysidine synthase